MLLKNFFVSPECKINHVPKALLYKDIDIVSKEKEESLTEKMGFVPTSRKVQDTVKAQSTFSSLSQNIVSDELKMSEKEPKIFFVGKPGCGALNDVSRVKRKSDNHIFYLKKPTSGMKFEQKEALEKITKWNKIARKILKEKLPPACLGDPIGVFSPEVKGQLAGGDLQATKESQQAYLALFNTGTQHPDLQKNASNLLILGTDYREEYEGSIFPLDISGVELSADFNEDDIGPIKLEKLEDISIKPKEIEGQEFSQKDLENLKIDS